MDPNIKYKWTCPACDTKNYEERMSVFVSCKECEKTFRTTRAPEVYLEKIEENTSD